MSKSTVDYDALFEDYLANRLTEESMAELKRVLASSKDMRARFVTILQEWELMSEAARQITANSSAAIVENLEVDSSNRGLNEELTLNRKHRPSLRFSSVRPRTRRVMSFVIPTAALAACIAVVVMLTPPSHNQVPASVAMLSSSTGDVVVVHNNKFQVGKAGLQLFPGDRIEVNDGGSSKLVYADKTEVRIHQHSDLKIDTNKSKAKLLAIRTGRVSASVTKQPVGAPMILRTPNAEAVVLGTELTLEFTDSLETTRLEVDHGLVAITDMKKQTRIEVPTGHYATVMDNQVPIARPLAPRAVQVAKDYRPGLRAMYFAGDNLNEKLFERIEPSISADLGLEASSPAQRQSNFMVRWDGYLQPLFSEKYLITIRADAGVRMYLDEKLLINAWESQRIGDHQAAVNLDASKRHQIRVEYKQPKSGMLIRMVWVSPSQNVEIVPVERLSTDKESIASDLAK